MVRNRPCQAPIKLASMVSVTSRVESDCTKTSAENFSIFSSRAKAVAEKTKTQRSKRESFRKSRYWIGRSWRSLSGKHEFEVAVPAGRRALQGPERPGKCLFD